MAIDILKPGKDPKDQWVYFKCDRCRCEFRVTMDETDEKCLMADYNLFRDYCLSYSADCPNCGKSLFGKLEPKE